MLLLHLCRKPRSLPSARLDPLLISVSKKVCGKDNWKLILTATTTTFFCNFQERELHTISLVTIYPLSSVSLLLSPTTVLSLVRKYCNSSSLNLTFPNSVGNSAAASTASPSTDHISGGAAYYQTGHNLPTLLGQPPTVTNNSSQPGEEIL